MALAATGIFVGGRALRMGGVPKGNLPYRGRSILEGTLESCAAAAAALGGSSPIYLIGESAAYAAIGVARLADDPPGIGPMGGLRAFLSEAWRRGSDAVVLAVDLPHLTPELLVRLYSEAPGVAALAPRQEDRWQPLFARYRPALALPEIEAALALGQTSLQAIFERLGDRARCLELSLAEQRALRDWDRPSDMADADSELER